MAKAKRKMRRGVGDKAWIGCALSICTLSKQRGRLRLDKNVVDEGLVEALERRIGGSVSGGGHHGDNLAPMRGRSIDRQKWYFGDEEEIVKLLQASWPWLTTTTQERARKLGVARPRKRRR